MHSGKMEELALPDNQYYIECVDKTIITNDKESNEVSAIELGKSLVALKSANTLEDDPVLKLPTASVTVVQPSYIVLTVLPYKNWAILVGDQHEIIAEVFSRLIISIFFKCFTLFFALVMIISFIWVQLLK